MQLSRDPRNTLIAESCFSTTNSMSAFQNLRYAKAAFWPNDTPLPPIGNPSVPGIISGQMFDPNTPYIWTMVRWSFALTADVIHIRFLYSSRGVTLTWFGTAFWVSCRSLGHARKLSVCHAYHFQGQRPRLQRRSRLLTKPPLPQTPPEISRRRCHRGRGWSSLRGAYLVTFPLAFPRRRVFSNFCCLPSGERYGGHVYID